MKITTREYYTLKDFLTNKSLWSDDYLIGKVSNDTKFSRVITSYFGVSLPTGDIFLESKINTLWAQYIVPKYLNFNVAYLDDDETATINDKYEKFLRLLANRIKNHYDEYAKLIDLFDSIKNNLLDAVKTQNKYQDTPQSTTSAGITTYDDTYNTNVSTSYNELGTKMARLKEVEVGIQDYYQMFCDSVCKGAFWYEN